MARQRWFARFALRMSPGTRHNFLWDFIASCLFSLFNVVFNQFYIPIAIRHGATNFEVGLLIAAPAVGLLFSPIWVGLIERSHPKPFVIWPNLAARLLVLLPAFYTEPWAFLVSAYCFQLLNGIQAPAYAALMTRIYPPENRGRLMGNVRVASGALMIPIVYLVGRWIDFSGPSVPLIVASATGVVSITAFMRVKSLEPERPHAFEGKRPPFWEQFKLLKGNPDLTVFFIAVTLSGFSNLLSQPLYQIIQVDKLHLTNAQIGNARIAYYACLLLAYFIFGWVIDRFNAKVAMKFGLLATSLIPLLYLLSESYPAVIAASGVQGVSDAVWDIGVLAYVFRLSPGREAAAFGIHLMLFGVRGTFAPMISTGLTHAVPMSALFLFAVVCSLSGVLLLMRKERRAIAEPRAFPG